MSARDRDRLKVLHEVGKGHLLKRLVDLERFELSTS